MLDEALDLSMRGSFGGGLGIFTAKITLIYVIAMKLYVISYLRGSLQNHVHSNPSASIRFQVIEFFIQFSEFNAHSDIP